MAVDEAKPKAGLEDVVAATSSICYLDGDRGVLAYYGYDIHDLAKGATFEEVCHLLWHGRLPNRAELGDVQTQLRTQIATAQKNNDPNLADLQKQLTDISASRETVFKGETLRGLLLTSYGFSEFGTKAGQAATVSYFASGLLFLLAIAGFLHALVTPRSKGFAVPEQIKVAKKEPVGV